MGTKLEELIEEYREYYKISWDEAVQMLLDEIIALQEEYGGHNADWINRV